MAQGVHKITEDFEKEIARYTGAPYVICVDNQSNALFLSLYYWKNFNKNSVSNSRTRVVGTSRNKPFVPQ